MNVANTTDATMRPSHNQHTTARPRRRGYNPHFLGQFVGFAQNPQELSNPRGDTVSHITRTAHSQRAFWDNAHYYYYYYYY